MEADGIHELGCQLRRGCFTVAVAESCTGGLISQLLTSQPGSSATFVGGIIAYANAVKCAQLGVDPLLLEAHGAVSEPVARQMAEGARRELGAEVALSTTGIAGPDGGTAEKPVGLVFVGLASARDSYVRAFRFEGSREDVRRCAAHEALSMLREFVEAQGVSHGQEE